MTRLRSDGYCLRRASCPVVLRHSPAVAVCSPAASIRLSSDDKDARYIQGVANGRCHRHRSCVAVGHAQLPPPHAAARQEQTEEARNGTPNDSRCGTPWQVQPTAARTKHRAGPRPLTHGAPTMNAYVHTQERRPTPRTTCTLFLSLGPARPTSTHLHRRGRRQHGTAVGHPKRRAPTLCTGPSAPHTPPAHTVERGAPRHPTPHRQAAARTPRRAATRTGGEARTAVATPPCTAAPRCAGDHPHPPHPTAVARHHHAAAPVLIGGPDRKKPPQRIRGARAAGRARARPTRPWRAPAQTRGRI